MMAKSKSYVDRMLDKIKESSKLSASDLDDLETIMKLFATSDREERKLQDTATGGIMTFGKHKGRPLTDIKDSDPQYILWLKKNDKFLTAGQKEILAAC
jgi:uncharacterized protein (DUF3820 family)